jgi:hypothetical protein
MLTIALPNGRKTNARRRALAAILLVAAFTAVATAAAHAATYTNFNRVTYAYSSSLTTSQEANHYQLIMMQATDAAKAGALKAANPNLKILMYSDPLDIKASDPTGLTTCTDYNTVMANHPTWILLDQSGQQIHYQGVSDKYVMDVGNSAYQQACLAHATALAKQNGFDGIFWDDLDPLYANDFGSGQISAKYPSNTTWQAAYYSLISYSGTQAHANNLLVTGNISSGISAIWQQWTTPMDGSMEEAWTDGGLGTAQQTPFWNQKLANLAWSETNGKYAILHSYNNTETGNAYGLASMLLAANGHSSYATSNTNYTNQENWYPEYTTAQQLGAPVGAYTKLSNGAYERTFQNGVVLVNPTSNAVGPISLGSGTYSGTSYTSVSTVTLAPTTAAILLADSTSGTTNPVGSAPVNSGYPTISGSAGQGQTLTASPGTWSGNPAPTYSYQWSRCTGTTCTAIPSATATTYKLQSVDVGATLKVTVTAANSAGSASATSAATATVPTPTFTVLSTPTRVTVRRGAKAAYTLKVNPLYGFTGSVSLTASGVPAGAAVSFSPSTTTSTSTLTVSTGSATAGTRYIKVTGSGGGKTAAVTLTLQITRG